ncbi:MAG: hypothetical protein C5S41_08630 [Candidatus Methanomarinus sp.]|nr:MAG: hypothetical protein C5S41_08630 [ANME-2 cluster archaeon]
MLLIWLDMPKRKVIIEVEIRDDRINSIEQAVPKVQKRKIFSLGS